MPSERLVTLMELLQIYAEDYVQSSSQLTLFADMFGNDLDGVLSADELTSFLTALSRMLSLCTKGDLPVTRVPFRLYWSH